MKVDELIDIKKFNELVQDELEKAKEKFPPFHSAHEGYAVIKEEIDELWDEIKSFKGLKSDIFEEEIIQIAAMSLRFYLNICCK